MPGFYWSKLTADSSAACASCRFYDDTKPNDAVAKDKCGRCRYNPPISQEHGLWPVVNGGNWCGRF
jgi:hypothetical protein